jgi:predicted transcriptional regulator
MKAYTVQIDDRIASAYADEARERGTSVEALLSAIAAEGAEGFGEPLTPEQIAAIEAGLTAERAGRLVSSAESDRRLAGRREA